MKTFHRHHEAILYAAQKRQEGYFAEVINTHCGHLWGEQTLGFQVILSEYRSDEPIELSALTPSSDHFLSKLVHYLAYLTVMGAIILSIIGLIVFACSGFLNLLDKVLSGDLTPIKMIVWATVGISTSLFISLKMYGIFRDKEHPLHTGLFLFFAALAIILALLTLLLV